MGKYTALRHKLPAFTESSEAAGQAAWFAKVSEWKQLFLGTASGENANAARLASEYAKRDQEKKALEAEISQLNIELEGLSQLAVESFENSGLQKIDLASGGSASLKDTPYTSIEDREQVLAWIKKNKMQEILTVPYQTLSGMNNERLVAGKQLIPGTKCFMKTKLAIYGVGRGDANGE